MYNRNRGELFRPSDEAADAERDRRPREKQWSRLPRRTGRSREAPRMLTCCGVGAGGPACPARRGGGRGGAQPA
eukprot:7668078-Pyramimonas_sp.AAC.1